MVVRTKVEFFKIANFLLKISMIYIFRFIFFKYHIYVYVYDFIWIFQYYWHAGSIRD